MVVSTDDEAIAKVARELGAEVPFMRPAEYATDTASSRSVILHALDFFAQRGIRYDAVVLLQPTSPLRRASDIRRAIKAFEGSQAAPDAAMRAEMAVSVCEARTNPYYSAFESDEAGFLHISKGDGHFTRRQDAPKVWEFNGAVYVIDAEALRRDEISRLKRILPVEMPSDRSIDLDSLADWRHAEEILAGTDINH